MSEPRFTYHSDKQRIFTGKMIHLINEGKRSRLWIHLLRSKTWHTPDEFRGEIEAGKIKWNENDEWVLANPIMAIKQADETINSLIVKRNDFMIKVLNYFQQS